MGGICSVLCSLSKLMVGTVSTDAVTSAEHQADTENILEKRVSRVKFHRVPAHYWQTARSFQSKDAVAVLFVCVAAE